MALALSVCDFVCSAYPCLFEHTAFAWYSMNLSNSIGSITVSNTRNATFLKRSSFIAFEAISLSVVSSALLRAIINARKVSYVSASFLPFSILLSRVYSLLSSEKKSKEHGLFTIFNFFSNSFLAVSLNLSS